VTFPSATFTLPLGARRDPIRPAPGEKPPPSGTAVVASRGCQSGEERRERQSPRNEISRFVCVSQGRARNLDGNLCGSLIASYPYFPLPRKGSFTDHTYREKRSSQCQAEKEEIPREIRREIRRATLRDIAPFIGPIGGGGRRLT